MRAGFLVLVLLVGAGALAVLRPSRPGRPGRVGPIDVAAIAVGELPVVSMQVLAAAALLSAVQGDLRSPLGQVGLAGAVIVAGMLGVVLRRALLARGVLRDALAHGLADRCAADVAGFPGRHRWVRTTLVPWPVRPARVRRTRDIPYGRHGRENRLDLYLHEQHRTGPVLVYFHGGGFRSGDKHREARALLHGLAERGWMCVSANYRLHPCGPDARLSDAGRAVAWARERAEHVGADPDRVVVAGSSAGGHLALSLALSATRADAPSAVVALYPYTGGLVVRPGTEVPPCFVAHGDRDTVVTVASTRSFVAALRSVSQSPVVYAELPGAQHGFDLFRSPRADAVVDAVASFVECCVPAR